MPQVIEQGLFFFFIWGRWGGRGLLLFDSFSFTAARENLNVKSEVYDDLQAKNNIANLPYILCKMPQSNCEFNVYFALNATM